MKFVSSLLLAVCLCALDGSAEGATLTIIITGPNSGNVSARVASGAPGGGICFGSFSNPTTCPIVFADGVEVRVMANSPSTPGIIVSGTGNAAGCAPTSTCNFVLNTDSSITVDINALNGPYPSIHIDIAGEGEISTDHDRCQNWELGYSGCPGAFYGAGSNVILIGRNVPGSLFLNFSNGTIDAAGCASSPCTFTLNTSSTVTAHFAALTSVAVTPTTATVNIGQNQSFDATGTFNSNATLTRTLDDGTGFSWRQSMSMSEARFSLAAGVINELLYAVGGIGDSSGPGVKLERFNPSTGPFGGFETWTTLAPLLTPREGLAVAVLGGELYALGGHTSGGVATAAVESYNPGTNSWTSRPGLPLARTWPAAAVVGTTLYAVGGGEQAAPSNTLEAYTAGSWTTLSAMPTARTGTAAAAVGGKLYVIGGYNGITNVATVEMYDPGTGVWTTKSPMPMPRTLLEAAVIDGVIYAVGGTNSSGALALVEAYNPATNSWTTLRAMSSARTSLGLGALDGRLWAVGGQTTAGTRMATVEGFRPPETTWWSDTPAVASIDPYGAATGLSAGQSGIIARAVGIDCTSCGTLIVKAIVEPPPPPPPPPPPDDECAQVTFALLPGSLPFTEVQITLAERPGGGTPETFAVPIGEPQSIPPGKYHLLFSTSAGYSVTSTQRGLNIACGDDVTVRLKFRSEKIR